MPGILDRLDPDHDPIATGQDRFSGHEVFGMFQLRANGIINDLRVIDGLELDQDGEDDLDWITLKFQGASNKEKFMLTLEATTMLFRMGLATRAELVNAINQSM